MRWVPFLLVLGVAGCGNPSRSDEGPTPFASGNDALTSYTSTDGVHFRPGPDRDVGKLKPVNWRAIRFADGKLILSRLADFEFHPQCDRVAVVQVGPPQGDFRRVSAWSETSGEPCDGARPRIELSPPGWTRATVAAPRSLDAPNPRAVDDVERAAIPRSAVLQPDRRTIVVGYRFGGCNELAAVDAVLRGSTVTVSVRTGVDKRSHPADTPSRRTSCPAFLADATTFVRLPEPAPPGTTVEVAP